MRVIDLNINQEEKKIEGKELNQFFKLEIPIDILPQQSKHFENQEIDIEKEDEIISESQVCQGMLNSNIMINYNYNPHPNKMQAVQLIAYLQGPTEAKFSSKQNSNACFIEVIIKGGSNSIVLDNKIIQRDLRKCEYDIKCVLEQLVQTIAYPKTILKFTLHILNNQPILIDDSDINQKIHNQGDFHFFSACMNACIQLIKKAGINQKQAQFGAVSLQIQKQKNDQRSGKVIDYLEKNEDARNFCIVDLVCNKELQILHMETVAYEEQDDLQIDILESLQLQHAQDLIHNHIEHILI